MDTLRIGICQINPRVGAIEANSDRIAAAAEEAVSRGAALLIFPELCLSGYPPEDLILKPYFIEDCDKALEALCDRLPKEALTLIGLPTAGAGRPRNSAAIVGSGRLASAYHKMLLPNYGVFDEHRLFEPGKESMCLQVGGARLGVHICEDSWDAEGAPVRAMEALRLNAVINLSASPFHRGKSSAREEVLRDSARNLGAYVFYCNMVGGQDELVFDGGSLVLDPEGQVVARAASFAEDLLLYDLPLSDRSGLIDDQPQVATEWVFIEPTAPDVKGLLAPRLEPVLPPLDEVYEALKLGLRDYLAKNGFKQALIAISGGIDSALVAMLAVDALGPERVCGMTMPSQYSSPETLADAELLASNLGIELNTIPIEPLYKGFVSALEPLWPGMEPDVTEENLQARIRGTLIMALSNKMGHLVLATGNKSELATGYCTLYGDMAGGFAPIKDVPKRMVFELCRWRNRHEGRELIPQSTIDRPPSAELRADQKDSDSLPPYDLLDPILERYVEQDQSIEAIIRSGYESEVVRRVAHLVDANEYKRRQAPPGIKITAKAFGRDRRMPISNAYR